MNLNAIPTIQQLRDLLAACDDRAGHHLLWVDQHGEVRITRLPRGRIEGRPTPTAADAQILYEVFQAGNGYVGPEAAADEDWVRGLFQSLQQEWSAAGEKPSVISVDSVPIPG